MGDNGLRVIALASAAALRIEDYVGEPTALDIGRLAGAAASVEAYEEDVLHQRERLGELRHAAELVSPEVIQVVAADMATLESRHAELLVPSMRDLEQKLDQLLRSTRSPSAEQKAFMRTVQRFIDAIGSWLEDLRDTRIRLLLLASEKMREFGSRDVVITSDDDLDGYFRDITGR